MCITVAAGRWSGSKHIENASYIAAVIWLASFLSYFMHMVWSISDAGLWRNAAMNVLAMGYFYIRWSARNAQHRLFHFILLSSYLITTVYYVFQLWVGMFMENAIGVSPWWYQFIENILFELELIFISVYALLFRRSRKDKEKYRSDYEGWFEKARAVKKAIKNFLVGKFSGSGDR